MGMLTKTPTHEPLAVTLKESCRNVFYGHEGHSINIQICSYINKARQWFSRPSLNLNSINRASAIFQLIAEGQQCRFGYLFLSTRGAGRGASSKRFPCADHLLGRGDTTILSKVGSPEESLRYTLRGAWSCLPSKLVGK
jgi:hypothetical protein